MALCGTAHVLLGKTKMASRKLLMKIDVFPGDSVIYCILVFFITITTLITVFLLPNMRPFQWHKLGKHRDFSFFSVYLNHELGKTLLFYDDTVAAQKYREYLDCSKVIKVVGMSTGVGFGYQPYQPYLVITQPDLSNQVLIHWEKP